MSTARAPSSICAPTTHKIGNHALRELQHYIKRKAATNLLHAPRTATALGRPFNTHVTINFWQLGCDETNVFDVFAKLRNERFQRWSSYAPVGSEAARNGPPTYAWVIEADKGLHHIHWMVHIATDQLMHFSGSLRKWLVKVNDGQAIPDDAVMIQQIDNAEGLKKYLAKGTEPHFARFCSIHPQDTGPVYGRKSGVSRNLGPAEWMPRKVAWKTARRRAA